MMLTIIIVFDETDASSGILKKYGTKAMANAMAITRIVNSFFSIIFDIFSFTSGTEKFEYKLVTELY